MKKKGITLALLLSCTTAAAAPALPSTNSDLRALEQNKAQTPQQAELTSVQTEGNKLSGEQSFTVDSINFTSPDNIDKAACEDLVADYVGQELTLSQLQQAADKVTAYLRKQGYTVATAFIPPQQIANGAVEIRVLLGNLGQVTVNNKSGLTDAVISSFIDRLHGGAAIKTNELETVLNNLNDLPGNHHNRRAVNHSIGNAGDGICRTGSASHQTDTNLPGYAGKSLCCMGSSLFMTDQYMVQCIFMMI